MQKKSFLFSLTLILVLFGTRGYSDLYPKEVFQGLQSLLISYQVEVGYEDLEENEDEVLARNLTLTPENTDSSLVFELPTLRLVRQGTNLVEVILPDTFFILNSSEDELRSEIGQGTFPGINRIIIEQDPEGSRFDYSIPEMEFRTQDESFALLVLFEDILGKVQFEDITQISDEGFTSTASIGEFSGRYQSRDGTGFAFKGINYTSNSIEKGVSTINNLGMDLPIGDYNFTVETTQVIIELENNSTLGLLINQLSNQTNINEDGLMMDFDTQDFVIAYEGFIQEAVAISDTDLNLSLDWSDVNEKFHLENDISLNNVRWESAHMEQLDPQGEFAEEVASLQTSYKVTGNKAFFDFESTEELNPKEIEFKLLSDWEISVFDLFSKGSGEYEYDRGKSSAESEAIVEGAEDFSDRLVAANIVPPEYAAGILAYMRILDPNSTSGNSFEYMIEMDNEFEVTVNGINLGAFNP